MNDARIVTLDDGIELVEDFFDGVFASLAAWLPELKARLTEGLSDGPLSNDELTELAQPGALRVLEMTGLPLYGAGFCASDLVVAQNLPLVWWQGPDRKLLTSPGFRQGKVASDLERLEWYRVPARSGERHVAGPFVDHLCSNQVAMTCSLPVVLENGFAGVICADILVASLEKFLESVSSSLEHTTIINAHGRVVLSTELGCETGDRFPTADLEDSSSELGSRMVSKQSNKYPFLVVGPRGLSSVR